MPDFDARAYWEDRLTDDWSLRGVGFRRMGSNFNSWAYRRRGERFEALVADLVPGVAQSRVLDVGSGTGFYLDAWARLSAKNVVGLDLTEVAVENLRKKFPDHEIHCGDISVGVPELEPESFDVVSAMDVLFHIVDHRMFADAIQTIKSLLRPNGLFIWSDLFLHRTEVVERHYAFRSMYRIEEVLDNAGFEIIDRRPMFYFLNEPRDIKSRLAWRSWLAAMFVASQSEGLAGAVGGMAYRLDNWLDSRNWESPSTEFMVCQRRA